MSFNINKQLNADEQELTAGNPEEATATTNEPVESIIEAPKAPEPRIETAHDDFDWSRDRRNVVSYTADEKAKYDLVYDNTFKQINDGEKIQTT